MSKNKGKSGARAARRSRSRNTTPLPAAAVVDESPEASPAPSFFTTNIAHISTSRTLRDIFVANGVTGANPIPSASNLTGILGDLKSLMENVQKRSETYDRLMREFSRVQRSREQEEQARLASEREAEERRRIKEKERHGKNGKATRKKNEREEDPHRPLAVGAHKPTNQDGMDVDNSSEISSPASSRGPPSLAGTGEGAKTPGSDASSPTSPHQPEKVPATQHYQLFGEDPNKFPDPITYHIREVTPGMTEAEKLEIYSVQSYPHDDLVRLTAGTAPDRDFSNAKESTKQTVSAQQFLNYVEPFIRPLNDEDTAFLRERGDRITPFQMVAREKKSYKELWAEEDDSMAVDGVDEMQLPLNQARGSMDDMNDGVAETDDVSCGPVLSRLLQAMRTGLGPARHGHGGAETNGDTTMVNGVANGDVDGDAEPSTNGDAGQGERQQQQSATFVPESQTATWKSTFTTPQLDPPPSMDERILGELKHLGFFEEGVSVGEAQYDLAEDDEISARLRYLQDELKRQGVVNGARKERVLELTHARMAMQEYMSIADDLDNQLNQAYLKRNKGQKAKPHNKKKAAASSAAALGQQGAGGASEAAGIAKQGLGDPMRTLLERKSKWNSWIGPIVDGGLGKIPSESVFLPEVMAELEKREAANWELQEEV